MCTTSKKIAKTAFHDTHDIAVKVNSRSIEPIKEIIVASQRGQGNRNWANAFLTSSKPFKRSFISFQRFFSDNFVTIAINSMLIYISGDSRQHQEQSTVLKFFHCITDFTRSQFIAILSTMVQQYNLCGVSDFCPNILVDPLCPLNLTSLLTDTFDQFSNWYYSGIKIRAISQCIISKETMRRT